MSQNTSSAVMQQRHEAHDSLDDYPTQPWCTRALIKHVLPSGDFRSQVAWEPACNRGHMATPLRESFGLVHTSDIHDYGWDGQQRVTDFLFAGSDPGGRIDWIITNPPFRLAEQFVERARKVAGIGVAVIVRTAFLEGSGRYNNLFKRNPPSIVAQFTERAPMVKARLTEHGSTATAYCWLVWMGINDTRLKWIPPCRKQLERPEDYAAYPEIKVDGKWVPATPEGTALMLSE